MNKSNDVILRTISKFAIVIILLLAVKFFFAGHHEPGGGFIAGLITATALVLLAIAFNIQTLRRVVPVDFRKITALGLLIAVLTGAGSFLFDVPFLTHSFGHFHIPVLGEIELATAVLFDLGVYLAVVGVTMTILLTIGEDQ